MGIYLLFFHLWLEKDSGKRNSFGLFMFFSSSFNNIIKESGANISAFELHVVFTRQARPINLRVPHCHVSIKCDDNLETPFGNPEKREKRFHNLSQKTVIRSAFFAGQVQFREF